MNDLIRKTLDRIQAEHIAPEPRWKFLSRKIGIWALIALAVALGALAISVVFFLLSQLDWDIYPLMHQNIFSYGLSVLPYFWLSLILVFVLLALLAVRRTENGYRLNWTMIVVWVAVGIVVIGFLMSRVGWGGRFNGMMMHRMPFYAQNIETKEKQWMQPEKGFLAGTIVAVSGNGIVINDLNDFSWKIQFTDTTLVRPSVTLAPGQMIKIIGNQESVRTFWASEIRPWVGQGMMGAGQGRGMMNNFIRN